MALVVLRHAAREDYAAKRLGENWQRSEYAAAHGGWNPRLTDEGLLQASAAGTSIARHLDRLGLPPVARIFSSPFTRCLQTSAAVATSLGLSEIAVERGLAEGLLEEWYRSWAVPGADSTWGGPPHAQMGVPLPVDAALHPKAHVPAGELLHGPAEAEEALRRLGVTDVAVDAAHAPFAPAPTYVWGHFESEHALGDRIEHTLLALKALRPDQTIVACTHGGPCGHAYERLLRQGSAPVAQYSAIYIYRPVPAAAAAEDAAASAASWTCDVAADVSHLATLGSA